MGSGSCDLCGAAFLFGHDGDDPFTSISVSFHDDSREDFATSLCAGCGDRVLSDLLVERE